MREIWKPIKGFEELYLVSNNGRIWSLRSKRVLKPKIDKYGYAVVVLYSQRRSYYRTIHRLVAQTFIPNPLELPTVNHINENKTDNSVENLEWMSIADNDNYGTRNKRMAETKCKKPVEQLLLDGTSVRYKGVKDASRKTGINRCQIAKCCKNISKTAGGYQWRYANETN